MQGYIQCEKLAQLDLRVRGHKKTEGIALNELMNITDSIQGIFDYRIFYNLKYNYTCTALRFFINPGLKAVIPPLPANIPAPNSV